MDKLKVLIVEDEVLIALQLKISLNTEKYVVCQTVTSGEEAIAYAKKEELDLILMDIRLAGRIDGIEAAREISASSKVWIIFMTGYSDRGLVERAMTLHPLAYLDKPVNSYQIDSVIEQACIRTD